VGGRVKKGRIFKFFMDWFKDMKKERKKRGLKFMHFHFHHPPILGDLEGQKK